MVVSSLPNINFQSLTMQQAFAFVDYCKMYGFVCKIHPTRNPSLIMEGRLNVCSNFVRLPKIVYKYETQLWQLEKESLKLVEVLWERCQEIAQ